MPTHAQIVLSLMYIYHGPVGIPGPVGSHVADVCPLVGCGSGMHFTGQVGVRVEALRVRVYPVLSEIT